MGNFEVKKSIHEINKKIKEGKAVVVTAEEMVDIVKTEGVKKRLQKGRCCHNWYIRCNVFFWSVYKFWSHQAQNKGI